MTQPYIIQLVESFDECVWYAIGDRITNDVEDATVYSLMTAVTKLNELQTLFEAEFKLVPLTQ